MGNRLKGTREEYGSGKRVTFERAMWNKTHGGGAWAPIQNLANITTDGTCRLWLAKILNDISFARDYGPKVLDEEIIEARRDLLWFGWQSLNELCEIYHLTGISYDQWWRFTENQKRLWNNDIHMGSTKTKRDKARRCYQPHLWDLEMMTEAAKRMYKD